MKKKIFILMSAIAVLSSCADQLDVKPFNTIDSGTATSTSKDIEALIVGAYTFLGDGDVLGGNMQRDAELIGDDGELFWDGTFTDPGEIWDKNMLITNGQAEATWLDCYRVINICNTVLANLSVVTADKVDRVEGEAKFIRGVMYFELVKVYGRTWTDGTPATNPGVPVVLEPSTTALVDRSSVAEVYTQVISDLQDAKTLLPTVNSFFATTYSASGMLSRVYMMQNDYANAALEADIVIASNEFGLLSDYTDNFNNSANVFSSRNNNENATTEDVFAIQVTSQSGINNMNTFFSTNGRGDIYVEQAHLDLYDQVNDERYFLFYDGERTGKWENQFGNVGIIRLAEMYLTRAEANLQDPGADVGDSPLNDINAIRNRAGLGDLGSVTITDILNERHLELAFEGHQIHDLKRTGRPVGALAFNAPKLIFPIPNREIIINPDMAQNESY